MKLLTLSVTSLFLLTSNVLAQISDSDTDLKIEYHKFQRIRLVEKEYRTKLKKAKPIKEPKKEEPVMVKEDDNDDKLRTALYFDVGYRNDDLTLSFSSPILDSSNGAIGELSMLNTEIIQYKLGAFLPIADSDSLFLSGQLSQGYVYNGDSQWSSYDGSGKGRGNEIYRDTGSNDSGTTSDYSIGLNYRVALQQFFITPGLGYSEHEQNYSFRNPHNDFPNSQSSGYANSTYDSKWQSLFARVAVNFSDISKKHNFDISTQYHRITRHKSQGDWHNGNLSLSHPVSYITDSKKGHGFATEFKYGFKPNLGKGLGYLFALNYKRFEAGSGRVAVYNNNNTISESSIDKVTWQSIALSVGLKYDF